MRASQNGFDKAVELLLDNHAEINALRDDTKRTALVLAARNGHLVHPGSNWAPGPIASNLIPDPSAY